MLISDVIIFGRGFVSFSSSCSMKKSCKQSKQDMKTHIFPDVPHRFTQVRLSSVRSTTHRTVMPTLNKATCPCRSQICDGKYSGCSESSLLETHLFLRVRVEHQHKTLRVAVHVQEVCEDSLNSQPSETRNTTISNTSVEKLTPFDGPSPMPESLPMFCLAIHC